MAQVIDKFANVSRITTLIAAVIAATLTLLTPLGYYYVSHQYLAKTMATENKFAAASISGIVADNPRTWRFEEIRVSEILHRRLDKEEVPTACRVRDRQGALVAEVAVALPPPLIVRVDEIFDAGVPAARIELIRSLRPLIENTILLGILSALVGGMVFLVLRLIPMRALSRACQDLTRSELRYRSLYNSMREGLGLFEPVRGQDGRMVDFRLVEANPVFLRINGRSLGELLNAKGEELMAGAIYEHLAEIATVMAHDRTFRFEKTVAGKAYDIFLFAPTSDSFAALIEDITERKRAEAEQAQMEIRVRQSQKMEAIVTLAGGIAHNFNNILTAIFGYTELAMDEADPTRRQEDLDQVKLGAKRAKELVSQMLSFGRTSGQDEQPLQVAPVIKEALKGLRSSIPTTIEIKQNLTSTGMVLADPAQIHQIIMNLCTNAYQAMRETGGVLSVSLGEIEIREQDEGYGKLAPGRYLELAVSDTGCGISPDIKERIFEPYFTSKEIGEGTGLGLYVTLGIIKSCRGHITFTSELGSGTTFHVYLPLLETKAAHSPREAAEELTGKGETILVVDDEAPIREFTERLFSLYGYQVTTCTNGLQALEELQDHPGKYDLVITDLTMPLMTGTELAQKIFALTPNLPIILCTGQSEPINRDKALALGICDYLTKPVGKNDFLSAIRKALAKKPQLQP